MLYYSTIFFPGLEILQQTPYFVKVCVQKSELDRERKKTRTGW